MEKLVTTMQAVLAALAAILPVVPAKARGGLAETLETVAGALKLGEIAADAADSLAEKFAALRTETEALAEVAETELEAAFTRVQAASAAFRAAYAESQSA